MTENAVAKRRRQTSALPAYLDKLPDTLVRVIASFGELRDLWRLSRVCKFFNASVTSNVPFTAVTVRLWQTDEEERLADLLALHGRNVKRIILNNCDNGSPSTLLTSIMKNVPNADEIDVEGVDDTEQFAWEVLRHRSAPLRSLTMNSVTNVHRLSVALRANGAQLHTLSLTGPESDDEDPMLDLPPSETSILVPLVSTAHMQRMHLCGAYLTLDALATVWDSCCSLLEFKWSGILMAGETFKHVTDWTRRPRPPLLEHLEIHMQNVDFDVVDREDVTTAMVSLATEGKRQLRMLELHPYRPFTLTQVARMMTANSDQLETFRVHAMSSFDPRCYLNVNSCLKLKFIRFCSVHGNINDRLRSWKEWMQKHPHVQFGY